MYATDQIVACNMAVGHERSPVLAPAKEHRMVLVKPDNDEIHVRHEHTDRRAVFDLGPRSDLVGLHETGPFEERRAIFPPQVCGVTATTRLGRVESGQLTDPPRGEGRCVVDYAAAEAV